MNALELCLCQNCVKYIFSFDIVCFALKNKNIVNVSQDIKRIAHLLYCAIVKKLEQGVWKVL